ncbi:MAG TPA: LacI family DNA-binding transcriptional regulator, partial [Pararhizobium sp.]|nr:LacI family DNA-binding transcriptional regulator [Pararhizobium sp.]
MKEVAAAGIRDVAEAAGVSVTTVSNVLNGRDLRMRSETKARVLKAIDTLGYRPNAIARQFRTGQTRTLGLIVPSVANPFWGAVAHQVERAALAKGFSVLICNSERDIESECAYAETLLASGVRGVIV